MCSLSVFPPPPPRGHEGICQVNGRLVSSPKDTNNDVYKFVNQVTVTRSQLQPVPSKISQKSAFLASDRQPNRWTKTLSTLSCRGIIVAVEELSSGCGWLSRIVKLAWCAVRWVNSLQGAFYPHWTMSREDICEKFSLTTDWRDGLIRCFAWHPHTARFALALCDDTVRIHGLANKVIPILKHQQQRGVAELSWRPFSGATLAIACQNGVIVWNVDPMSVVTRPSSSSMQHFVSRGHAPVTSVQWSPCGRLLVSGSPLDTSMIVWDVATDKCVSLKRVAGGGVSLLRWSPDGHRLFAATPLKVFRVWETVTWTCDWWSCGSGRFTAACWSPDGSALLTATENESLIYYVSFSEPSDEAGADLVGGSKTAVPIINVANVQFDFDSERISIGGHVQAMRWNRSGQWLAVSFTCEDVRQECVAVFRTRIKPVLDVNPCGFIRGPAGEVAQWFDFYDGQGECILSVCWSSGAISHIPFYHPSQEESNLSSMTCDTRTNPSTPSGKLFSLPSDL